MRNETGRLADIATLDPDLGREVPHPDDAEYSEVLSIMRRAQERRDHQRADRPDAGRRHPAVVAGLLERLT